jgi:hypothetical protein
MAQVPNDEIGTVQQDPIPGRAIPRFADSASPADFGAGLGQGIEQAANDVSAVQREQAAQQKQQQEKANQDADRVQLAGAITSLSKTRDALQFGKDANDPNAAFRQTGPALATISETYGAAFDTAAQQISQGLTPHQQSMFSERVASEKDSFDLQLRRYQFEQSNREAAETFGNAKAQSIQTASNNYRDPAATPQAREDLFNAGMALATRGGKDSITAYKQSGYARDLDQLHEGVIGANLADGNVNGAQKYLNQWGTDLSSGVVKDALQNRITAAADRLEAKGKETARDAWGDALSGARNGVAGSSSLVSDQQLKLLRPNDWERQRDYLNKASDIGAQGKAFDQMTPAAIETKVQAGRDAITASPGIENDLNLQSMLEREAQRSITQRNADARQFMVKTASQPELDFSKPADDQAQILNSRFNTQQQDSKQIGTFVPALSRKESSTFAATLDAQPSDGKLAMLNQYRQSLGDSRFTALMQQVRPDSPVTTKAAMLLPRDPGTAPYWYQAAYDSSSDTARTIMQGQDILNPGRLLTKEEGKGGFKGGIELPNDLKFRDQWNDSSAVRNGVYAGRPQEANAQYEAAKSYYAATVAMSGKVGTEVDPGKWKDAIAAVAGKTATVGGSVVPVPRGMDPSMFPAQVKTQLATAEKQQGLPAGALNGYGLQEIGPYGSGRYGVVHDGKHVSGPKTDWIQFDLNGAPSGR